ncbi:hypothetical protein Ddye_010962 [Dipteronia dyeriana]|uniref:Cation/H(+) antiporter central domain-containing protein n=1 Tax=Dipteronia dyeriana TaxID=168575 RepID=A0AAE0CNN5_9ROSI|nr:hypothetical protein Ddye_010962 [Dipteronia dyeriana]
MHLVELTDRSSSIVMVQKTRKNGVPFTNRIRRGVLQDQIVAAFKAYSQLGRVTIRHSTAVSTLPTMHEDIFHLAEKKRVGMIILPFHKQWREDGEEAMDSVCHGWREISQTVLQSAPCSVAVLVDRGFSYGSETVAEPGSIVPKRELDEITLDEFMRERGVHERVARDGGVQREGEGQQQCGIAKDRAE